MKLTSVFHDNLIYLIVLLSGLVLSFFAIGMLLNSVLSNDEKVSKRYDNEIYFKTVYYDTETNDDITEKMIKKRYKELLKVTPSKREMSAMFEKLANYKNANISTQVNMMTGSGKIKRKVKVYLSSNNPLIEEISETYLDMTKNQTAYALIGKENLTYVLDGKINLDGTDVVVAGVLKNTTLKNDNRVVLVNSFSNEYLKRELVNLFCNIEDQKTLVVGSDKEIGEDAVNSVKTIIDSTKREFELSDSAPDYDGLSESDRVIDFLKDKIMLIIAVFTFINLLAVNSMWIKRRKSEMAIKKTYGYSDMQVLAEYFKEYFIAMLMGIGICSLIFGLYVGINWEKIRMEYVRDTSLWVIFAVFVMLFFNYLVSYKYVSSEKLASGIKER